MTSRRDAQLPAETVDVNYFVCTLGQAAAFNTEKPHAFKTINEFIDHQARQFPHYPAVGFPSPLKGKEKDKEWNHAVYSRSILEIHYQQRETNLCDFSFPKFTTVIHIFGA